MNDFTKLLHPQTVKVGDFEMCIEPLDSEYKGLRLKIVREQDVFEESFSVLDFKNVAQLLKEGQNLS